MSEDTLLQKIHEIQLACRSLIYEQLSDSDRVRIGREVSNHLENRERTFATAEMAFSHCRIEAAKYFQMASALDSQLCTMRAEVRQARAELAAVTVAASALCDLIDDPQSNASLTIAAAELRSALHGEQTQRLIKEREDSINKWQVLRLVQKMFRKLPVDSELASSAARWLQQKMIP